MRKRESHLLHIGIDEGYIDLQQKSKKKRKIKNILSISLAIINIGISAYYIRNLVVHYMTTGVLVSLDNAPSIFIAIAMPLTVVNLFRPKKILSILSVAFLVCAFALSLAQTFFYIPRLPKGFGVFFLPSNTVIPIA